MSNEYDALIVDMDRERAELLRLGRIDWCGKVAPVGDFASAVYARMQQRRAGVVSRPATDADCVALAAVLRPADRDEIADGCTPLAALRDRLRQSSYAMTALDQDGRIVCMFGVGSVGLMSEEGSPWVLWSDLIAMHWRLFVRLSPGYLARMLDQHSGLSGLVDERRADVIRYLKWLGFDIGTVKTPGNGRVFLPFFTERSANVWFSSLRNPRAWQGLRFAPSC